MNCCNKCGTNIRGEGSSCGDPVCINRNIHPFAGRWNESRGIWEEDGVPDNLTALVNISTSGPRLNCGASGNDPTAWSTFWGQYKPGVCNSPEELSGWCSFYDGTHILTQPGMLGFYNQGCCIDMTTGYIVSDEFDGGLAYSTCSGQVGGGWSFSFGVMAAACTMSPGGYQGCGGIGNCTGVRMNNCNKLAYIINLELLPCSPVTRPRYNPSWPGTSATISAGLREYHRQGYGQYTAGSTHVVSMSFMDPLGCFTQETGRLAEVSCGCGFQSGKSYQHGLDITWSRPAVLPLELNVPLLFHNQYNFTGTNCMFSNDITVTLVV